MLAHLGWAGGAVETDHVYAEGGEGVESGWGFCAREHASVGFYGDLKLDRQGFAASSHGFTAAVDGGFGAEQVVDGFYEEYVYPALNEGFGLLGEGVTELLVCDLPQRGELGARPDGACHPAGLGGG